MLNQTHFMLSYALADTSVSYGTFVRYRFGYPDRQNGFTVTVTTFGGARTSSDTFLSYHPMSAVAEGGKIERGVARRFRHCRWDLITLCSEEAIVTEGKSQFKNPSNTFKQYHVP